MEMQLFLFYFIFFLLWLLCLLALYNSVTRFRCLHCCALLALYVYVPVCRPILVIFFVSQINWIGLDNRLVQVSRLSYSSRCTFCVFES